MELKYIVYITINLCNGKFYIGVHETNPDVFDGYIGCGVYRQSNASKHFAFHKAVRKYGYDKFKRTTLRIFPHTEKGREAAYQLEAELITPTVLKSKTCYNISVGGQGGVKPDLMKPVYQFDLSGKLLNTYQSVGQAAKSLNLPNHESVKQAIKNNCAGRVNTAYGFIWSRESVTLSPTNNQCKPVAQYTMSGKFIRHFDSIAEANSALQCSSIHQAIQHNSYAVGYQWRYFTGDTSDIAAFNNIKRGNKSQAILMFDKAGKCLGEYANSQECSRLNTHLKLSTSQINYVLNGVLKTHRGLVFKYKDEDIV